MGQSLEAFGQWKALVSFLFGCENAVSIFLVVTLRLQMWNILVGRHCLLLFMKSSPGQPSSVLDLISQCKQLSWGMRMSIPLHIVSEIIDKPPVIYFP